MEKYKVKITNNALNDLDEIYTYIAENLQEPVVAFNLIDRIEDEVLSLAQMPYRCPERRIGQYANKGYRQLLVKNFTVIYRIDENSKHVIVVTIRYSRSLF